MDLQTILDFWISEMRDYWLEKNTDPNIQKAISQKFSSIYNKYVESLTIQPTSPQEYLALIILFSQLPRYITSKSETNSNNIALMLAKIAIDKKYDKQIEAKDRALIYIPFKDSPYSENKAYATKLLNDLSREVSAISISEKANTGRINLEKAHPEKINFETKNIQRSKENEENESDVTDIIQNLIVVTKKLDRALNKINKEEESLSDITNNIGSILNNASTSEAIPRATRIYSKRLKNYRLKHNKGRELSKNKMRYRKKIGLSKSTQSNTNNSFSEKNNSNQPMIVKSLNQKTDNILTTNSKFATVVDKKDPINISLNQKIDSSHPSIINEEGVAKKQDTKNSTNSNITTSSTTNKQNVYMKTDYDTSFYLSQTQKKTNTDSSKKDTNTEKAQIKTENTKKMDSKIENNANFVENTKSIPTETKSKTLEYVQPVVKFEGGQDHYINQVEKTVLGYKLEDSNKYNSSKNTNYASSYIKFAQQFGKLINDK